MSKSFEKMMPMITVLVFSLLVLCVDAQTNVPGTDGSDSPPFLVVAAWRTVTKLEMNGTYLFELAEEPNGGIISVDYHYKKGLLFYLVTDFEPSLYVVPLFAESKESAMDKRILLAGRYMEYPIGLAVDWINNQVYWTDRSKHTIEVINITEVDLEKDDFQISRPQIMEELPRSSYPQGLSIFPQMNYGLLFLMLKGRGSTSDMLRIRTDTSESTLLRQYLCSSTTTLDHINQRIYWIDECGHKVEESLLNGRFPKTVVGSSANVAFSRGLAQYHKACYATQTSDLYNYEFQHEHGTSSNRTHLYNISKRMTMNGLQVVHPSKQPSIEQLLICEPLCVNGHCSSGLCICNPGWTGSTCSDALNECDENNGGCEQECVDSQGSYYCQCRPPYYLQEDGKSCLDLNECSENNGGCEQECVDSQGSFYCQCRPSYYLQEDEKSCLPLNECGENNGGCEQECVDSQESFYCQCRPPYYLQEDGKSCLSTPAPPPPPPTMEAPGRIIDVSTESPTVYEYSSQPPTPSSLEPLNPTTSIFTGSSSTAQFQSTTTEVQTRSVISPTSSVASDGPRQTPIVEHPTDGLMGVPEGSASIALIAIIACIIILLLLFLASVSYGFLIYYKYNQRKKGSYNVYRRDNEMDNHLASNGSRFVSTAASLTYVTTNREGASNNQATNNCGGASNNQATITGSESVESFERISISSIAQPLAQEVSVDMNTSEVQMNTADLQPAEATSNIRPMNNSFSIPYASESIEMYFSL